MILEYFAPLFFTTWFHVVKVLRNLFMHSSLKIPAQHLNEVEAWTVMCSTFQMLIYWCAWVDPISVSLNHWRNGLTFVLRILWFKVEHIVDFVLQCFLWLQNRPRSSPLQHHQALCLVWTVCNDTLCSLFAKNVATHLHLGLIRLKELFQNFSSLFRWNFAFCCSLIYLFFVKIAFFLTAVINTNVMYQGL